MRSGDTFRDFEPAGWSNEGADGAGTITVSGYHLSRENWSLGSTEESLTAVLDGSVRAAAALRGQGEAALAKMRQAVEAALETYRAGDRYAVPMPAVVVSAMHP